jgi:hypothetical protein
VDGLMVAIVELVRDEFDIEVARVNEVAPFRSISVEIVRRGGSKF